MSQLNKKNVPNLTQRKALCHPQQVQLIVVTKLQNAKYSTSCIADYFPVLPELSHDDEQIVATLKEMLPSININYR